MPAARQTRPSFNISTVRMALANRDKIHAAAPWRRRAKPVSPHIVQRAATKSSGCRTAQLAHPAHSRLQSQLCAQAGGRLS